MARVRPQITATVKAVYSGIFPGITTEPVALRKTFTPGALRSFLRTDIGPPDGVERLQIARRKASIGIDVQDAKHAVVEVELDVGGVLDGAPWGVTHSSQLWLERGRSGWRVVAFDVTEEPA